MKIVRVCLIIMLTVFSYSIGYAQNKGLDNWVGTYLYNEDGVKANAGYTMTMEWKLVIKKINDHYQGVLSIDGQQTFIKYLADINGDPNTITIKYNKQTDGPIFPNGNPVKDEVLFVLKRVNKKLITKWAKLTPRLADKWPTQCNCFIKNK